MGREKGHKVSEETRKKISAGHRRPEAVEKKRKFMSGPKNPAWKGGISREPGYKRNKNRIWIDNNRDKKRHTDRQRKHLKRHAEGSHTLGEWETLKAQYNWTCPCCKKSEPEIKLTEDHIIPLTKGGSNNIENIQPLCVSCNSRKRDKIIEKYL